MSEHTPSPLWQGVESLRQARRLFKEELKDYKGNGLHKHSHTYIQLKCVIHTLKGMIYLFERILSQEVKY